MSATTSPVSARNYSSLPIPAAVFEVLGYLIILAAGILAFIAGWLAINSAVVLTVMLLSSLIVLSWLHLGRGRHPVFLFLCTLMLFQGGRLIAYCLGAEPQPMRIVLMLENFDIPQEQQGIVLLCIALAAICVYAPSRWSYRPIAPPDVRSVQKYLPYLYLLFAVTWPAQLFKNYKYYEYVMKHGGYVSLFLSHTSVASTVPFLVRAIALIPFPVFIALFVFERRKRFLWSTTCLYIASTSVILAFGSRGGIVTLVLTLWWITRIKSRRPPRLIAGFAILLALLFLGDFVRQSRENVDARNVDFLPREAIAIEGAPLNMTEMSVRYRKYFARYSGFYVLRELESGFVGLDNLHFHSGESLDLDASALLNPVLVAQGNRVASSYIGEAYIAGGLPAVVLASLAIGVLLTAFYNNSNRPRVLLLVALTLQDILIMPRAQLLDWLSVLIRNLLLIGIVIVGWNAYSLVTSIRHMPNRGEDPVLGPTQHQP